MIDHDVPIPTNTRSQHPILPRAVLAAMQVGDSVRIVGNSREIPVSYTHLTLPTNREV